MRKRYTSAAAGAYQFLPGTWGEASRKLKLADFGPASQDQAALYLVEKRGALRRFEREGLSAGVLARLSAEWASLPASHGGSYYGQPVKGGNELRVLCRRAGAPEGTPRRSSAGRLSGAQRGQRPGWVSRINQYTTATPAKPTIHGPHWAGLGSCPSRSCWISSQKAPTTRGGPRM